MGCISKSFILIDARFLGAEFDYDVSVPATAPIVEVDLICYNPTEPKQYF